MKVFKIELAKKSLIETEEGFELITEKPVTYPLVLTNAALHASTEEGIIKADLKGIFASMDRARKEIEKEGMEFEGSDALGFFPTSLIYGLLYTAYRGGVRLKGETSITYNDFLERVNIDEKEAISLFFDIVKDYFQPKN